MRESIAETLLGVIVVAIAAAFLWFSLSANDDGSGGDRYALAAYFDDVSGIERGTDVRMAGVKVGLVTDKALAGGGEEARLSLAIDESVEVPADSMAKVVSDGLLGGAYVAIERGQAGDSLPADGSGEIRFTRGSVDLIDAFAAFANVDTGEKGRDGPTYRISAAFNNASGVSPGTEVRVAGVKMGEVVEKQFDPQRFEATLVMEVSEQLQLPDDSDARIVSDGLLGRSYVAVEPGGSFDNIPQDGTGEIIYTRGAVDLLTLFASFAQGDGDSE
jgi:phospholipid/cholesterol/gamma-HCH transport system substrate-binding protein